MQLLDCVRWELLTPHEAAAAALFVQHNAKWVDRRLSTALAWRLLNARIAADLAADGVQQGRQQLQHHLAAQDERAAGANCGGVSGTLTGPAAAAAADASSSSRAARQHTLLWGLDTARLEAWTGNTMFCTARRIPCSWQQLQRQQAAGGGSSGSGSGMPSCRPMALQLEREDPRHAAAKAVSGTSSGGGATGGGVSGWDLQLSLDPDTFPPGFEVRRGAA